MIKGGFIGFGRMGITHFSILNSNPAVDIQGVCDQSSTMMNIVQKYTKIKTFSNYREMIDTLHPDFVVISTPTDSHSEIIRYALERNVHVFCEKPFGLSSAESKTTLDILSSRQLVNQIGYVNRFNEVFMEVKRLVDLGILGDIKYFCSEMYGATVLKDSGSSWRGKRKKGGGCMYEFASHCIDLVVYLFGKPDKVAGSMLQMIYSKNVEDLVSSTFIYQNGIKGNIIVNWSDASYRKPANILTVSGTNGKIIADKHAYKIYLVKENPSEGLTDGWNTRYITDFAKSVRFYVRGNEFTRQLDYFIERIQNTNGENISSFYEALKTDETMEMIIQDAACAEAQAPNLYETRKDNFSANADRTIIEKFRNYIRRNNHA